MNNKEIIESGLLESYVLGLCSDEENKLVQNACVESPELVREIESIEEALISLYSAQSPPAARIKEQVLAKIFAADDLANTTEIDNGTKAAVISINNTKPKGSNRLVITSMAAALVVLLGSFVFVLFLYNTIGEKEDTIQSLRTENAVNQKRLQEQLRNAEFVLSLSTDTSIKQVVLLPTQKDDKSSSARVYWNKNKQEVFLHGVKLPAIAGDMQYQLWALQDGKPVDAGVFDLAQNTVALKMRVIERAQAFAVTLEKKGGTQVPTLSRLYLMGEI